MIERDDQDLHIHTESKEVSDFIDPYAIPDEEGSIEALKKLREMENNDSYFIVEPEDEDTEHIDDYAIPDDPGSIDALRGVREIEKNYFNVSESASNGSQEQKAKTKIYRITEEDLEHRADVTGQSTGTILIELGLTEADVEPVDNMKK